MRRLVLIVVAAMVVVLAVEPASAGKARVKAVNFDFKPKTVHVSVGDKVVWKNVEGRHTVTARKGGKGKFDKVISGNDRVSRRFNRPQTWRYFCRFHVDIGMKGKVVIG